MPFALAGRPACCRSSTPARNFRSLSVSDSCLAFGERDADDRHGRRNGRRLCAAIQSEFGPGTWVLGYTDDMIAYIPSRRVWDEGGYEGGSNLFEYGRPALRWNGDIEDRIAATVQKLVGQVRP